jgi:hypothetical protein
MELPRVYTSATLRASTCSVNAVEEIVTGLPATR